ncbi:hypothetical protein HW132_08145 [Brasilonema sp. CT11]|nr:hypothetical protein [Brasilonema sp. CT11]
MNLPPAHLCPNSFPHAMPQSDCSPDLRTRAPLESTRFVCPEGTLLQRHQTTGVALTVNAVTKAHKTFI